MKNANIAERILDFLANHPGRHKTSKIAEAIGASIGGTSSALGELAQNSEIKKIKQGTYSGNNAGASTQTRPDAELQNISSSLRAADANKNTIDKLLNIYDDLLDNYGTWAADNFKQRIDFEKQLLFIENFKWLTMIGDKLMKRWSLEHVGYDTNTRLAQEDAKAKTAEKEKAALEDAPIEEQVRVIASFDLETKKLIDGLPTLESLTEKEAEEIKV